MIDYFTNKPCAACTRRPGPYTISSGNKCSFCKTVICMTVLFPPFGVLAGSVQLLYQTSFNNIKKRKIPVRKVRLNEN